MAEGGYTTINDQELKREKVCKWSVRKSQRSAKSDDSLTFRSSGCECFFRCEGCQGHYTLSIMDKSRKKEMHPFEITAYLDTRNGPEYFERKIVRELPHRLLEFSEEVACHKASRRGFSNLYDVLKFIFIFHDGMTLRSENHGEGNECFQSLSNDLYRYLKESSDHDVMLPSIDNRTVKAHSKIMEERSKTFKDLLKSGTEFPKTDFDSLQQVVAYLYSGKVPELTSRNARNLHRAANVWGVLPLMEECANFIVSTMTEGTAFEILKFAHDEKDCYFKKNAIAFILQRKLHLQKSFSQLNKDLTIEVLTHAVQGIPQLGNLCSGGKMQ